MANAPQGRRRPRIRKTAPTIRQQAEAAQAETQKQPSRLVRIKSGVGNSRLNSRLATILRPVKKVLGWLVPRYFINSWREVRQVTWPSRRETWRLTGAVFVFAIIFGAMIAGVDKGLDEIFKKLILR